MLYEVITTVSLYVWERLYKYDPVHFPPPALENVAVSPGKQFAPEALEEYPVLEIIIDQANEAIGEGFGQDVFLELCINSLKNELLKIKRGGKHSARSYNFV